MRNQLIFGLVFGLVFSGVAVAQGNIIGNLSGDEEVPPVDTRARGQAVFNIRGGDLSYQLIVANITNVFAAHIHCAPFGVNGPVGVTLYSGTPVSVNGILAQGPLLAPNPGNFCAWNDVDDIIDALLSGDTYVNVHTLQIFTGEIRGQLH